jgi:hypothetical protein
MQTSELFLAFLRRLIFAFLVLALGTGLCHAQNGGNVGIYTREVTVFTNQSATKSSTIFPDFGFGCNFLSFKNSSFVGMIDVEWSPTGAAPFYSIVQYSATSLTPDSGYHTLQIGGFWPNMRSTVTPTSGNLSAWYTAQAGPCPLFGSGIGSNGPTSPIVCDLSAAYAPASGATNSLLLQPQNAGDVIVVCDFSISFQGATSTGGIVLSFATSAACSTLAPESWAMYTTSSTPQTFNFSVLQHGSATYPYLCVTNTSGSAFAIGLSYASVHGL